MKEMLKEDIRIKSKKFREADPYNEEDWDEYEIRTGDIFYFFGIDNTNIQVPTAFVGVSASEIKDDNFYLNIRNCSNKDLKGERIKLSEDTKNQVNSERFSLVNNTVDKKRLIAVVNNMIFNRKYRNIHEAIRRELYKIVKTKSTELQNIEKKLDTFEDTVIELKRNLKSKNEFPPPGDFEIGENEFVVMKVTKDGNRYNVETNLAELSEKADDKGGHDLVDVDTGSKVTYLLKTHEKLRQTGYLLLKSKRDENKQTYITNDIEKYVAFVERIVETTNNEIDNQIKELRDNYRTEMSKIGKLRTDVDTIRTNYQEFNFSELVEELKQMIGKK